MPVSLYGISNCDTVKKAKKWLDENGIEYSWIDFRKDGIEKTQVDHWLQAAGLDTVLNKRGTTWRKLSPEQQAFSSNEEAAKLICLEPTLIKRPVMEHGGQVYIGFKPENYEAIFK